MVLAVLAGSLGAVGWTRLHHSPSHEPTADAGTASNVDALDNASEPAAELRTAPVPEAALVPASAAPVPASAAPQAGSTQTPATAPITRRSRIPEVSPAAVAVQPSSATTAGAPPRAPSRIFDVKE